MRNLLHNKRIYQDVVSDKDVEESLLLPRVTPLLLGLILYAGFSLLASVPSPRFFLFICQSAESKYCCCWWTALFFGIKEPYLFVLWTGVSSWVFVPPEVLCPSSILTTLYYIMNIQLYVFRLFVGKLTHSTRCTTARG